MLRNSVGFGRRIAGLAAGLVLALGAFAAPAAAMDDMEYGIDFMAPVETAVVSDEDRQCLAMALYHEARGEPVAGQEAVGRVILNRVDSKYHPDTVCDVVYKNAHLKNRCQFSFACDGISDKPKEKKAWKKKLVLAEELLSCDADCREARREAGTLEASTHYHATYVNPRWAKKLKRTGQVGNHIFYWTATI